MVAWVSPPRYQGSRQSSMRSMSSEKRSMSPKAFDRLVPPLNTMDSAKPLLWKRWSKV